MDWINLHCLVDAEEAWDVAAKLETSSAVSVSLQPLEPDSSLQEPEPGAMPLAGRVRLNALFASRAAAEAVALLLGEARDWRLETCQDRDWIVESRAGFTPRRFGERLWIVPEWCEPPDPTAVNVVLAPGLAFGTGQHPSTALCLEWLAAAALEGRTMVDYGCGSGILAVTAAKLGARRVFAVDNDPQARAATGTNAVRNAVTVTVCAPEALAPYKADLLIANILARPLIALADEFRARVRAGGRIVLAGITTAQADGVAAVYAPGARVIDRMSHAGWTCLELRRECK